MTRLRLRLVDVQAIDEAQLRALGARGVVRPGGDALQVVLGPIADEVAGEIRTSVRGALEPDDQREPASAPRRSRSAADDTNDGALPHSGAGTAGGIQRRSGRLIFGLGQEAEADEATLKRLGARAVVRSPAGRLHALADERTLDSIMAALSRG
jgi:PTS system N-acetylglucosamine-specific IIC component